MTGKNESGFSGRSGCLRFSVNTHNPSVVFDLCGRPFVFRPAPHLTKGQDWHTAYIGIVDSILEAFQ